MQRDHREGVFFPPEAIVIAGPTGIGKTALGIQLAKAIGGDIVSVDSRQIYRGMDIGTAKPAPTELAMIKHHLVDICDPNEVYTAGKFSRTARSAMKTLQERGTRPIIIGGSGLYLSAVVDGLFAAGCGDPSLREQLVDRFEKEGLATLYLQLGTLDPIAQAMLSPNDAPRVLRALEVALGTRANRSEHFRQQTGTALPEMPMMFALSRERDVLYNLINERVDTMVAAGWIDETERLLQAGYHRECVGLKSLGYQELVRHLRDCTELDTEIETIKQRTRRFAKRQITWFRRDRRLRWLDLDLLGIHGALERITAQVHT